MKVLWRSVLPNANAAHFCDTLFRHKAVLPEETISKSRNPATLGTTRIIYCILLVNITGLYLSWVKLNASHRAQMTDRIPKLPTDRHFLNLSETCLYLVHFSIVFCSKELILEEPLKTKVAKILATSIFCYLLRD